MSLSSVAVWFLLAALCYVVALLAFVGVRVAKGREEIPAFPEVRFWLRCLLTNGYDGESVVFHDTLNSRFIRFEKYSDPAGSPGIKLTFPEIGWGEQFLPGLRDLAVQKGLVFQESEGAGPAYAQIPVGCDIDEAYAVSRAIWTEFFGLDEQSQCLLRTPQLLTIDELLGTSDHPCEDARKERYLRHLNARLEHAGLGWLKAESLPSFYRGIGSLILLGGMGFLTALVGLPLATLWARGATPDWRIEFAGIGLQGSTTGLILFCLYLLSAALIYRLLRLSLIDEQSESRFERAVHAPKRLVFALIPVAVILVWLQV